MGNLPLVVEESYKCTCDPGGIQFQTCHIIKKHRMTN